MNSYSHKLLANKDEDLIFRLHVSDEVKNIRLFLFFFDQHHCLLHCVHSLEFREMKEAWTHLEETKHCKSPLKTKCVR